MKSSTTILLNLPKSWLYFVIFNIVPSKRATLIYSTITLVIYNFIVPLWIIVPCIQKTRRVGGSNCKSAYLRIFCTTLYMSHVFRAKYFMNIVNVLISINVLSFAASMSFIEEFDDHSTETLLYPIFLWVLPVRSLLHIERCLFATTKGLNTSPKYVIFRHIFDISHFATAHKHCRHLSAG